jgi:hypothetical protein
VGAHLVLEVAVLGDALEVALLLLFGAHARGAGYAVCRSALLEASLLSVNFPAKRREKKSVAERTPYVGHYSLNQCTWELVGVALPVGCRLQFLGSSWLWFVSGDRELDLKQP